MYEKDGEKYFVFDSHLHFWDASPENWRPGAEEYAKGWIECFHAYQGLGPADTHWSIEHFQKYSIEDFEKDVFGAGVDKAVLQSTYLKEWYTNGFNDIDQNASLLDRFGDRLILNGRWDPREGQAGLEQLERDHEQYGLQGCKLYTAEWYKGSRGWKLTDPEAIPFLDKCAELGIRNLHVHKGPTIWPLDKDAFDVSDVDHVATDYNGKLNFIVEHVGLPRIEDFCFMATQEPNVYAGLSVVIGGLMHARPKFFAKVMGELLFWVGEDKMTFGSDYGIWEPKWQVEGFVDWEMPDDSELADYPRLGVEGKKKILGLNAAKLYDVEVPEEYRIPVSPEEPASQDAAVGVA
jgi:predicted TIM-barrel fold metal-dependent hydrolase